MHSEAMIAVADVRVSVAWYKALLGCDNDHDSSEFDRLLDGDRVLLMLHQRSAEEHGLRPPVEGAEGSGVLVWFYVDDLKAVQRRAKKLGASVVVEPHINPQAGWSEFTLRDPDGYRIAIAQAH
jgi:predicted enzyme related to lactoylglutathione lyase